MKHFHNYKMRLRIITILCLSLFLFNGAIIAQNTNYGTDAGNAGTANSCYGYKAGDIVTGNYNNYIGTVTGLNSTSGSFNTFNGYRVGVLNTTGSYNSFFGSKAGTYNKSGYKNTFIGSHAGYYNKTGYGNVFLGYYAGFNERGSDKLYIDNSNTSTPLIYGDFNSNELVFNGNVGIGTNDPRSSLHIKDGALSLTADPTGPPYITFHEIILNPSYNHPTKGIISIISGPYPGYIHFYNPNSFMSKYCPIKTGGLTINNWDEENSTTIFPDKLKMYDNSQNLTVEISNSSGDASFAGKVTAEEVEVTLDVFPDFVFNKDYKLRTINEVEVYINENNHLPDVPSEAEVIENGLNLGDMDAILLQKIEELTLYVIELEKRIDKFENK